MDLRAAAVEAARRNGVDPDLFLRLVQQESGFRPQVVSPAGAIGPAQLMPGTAAELGVDPRDPLQNLDGGARYFRQQLDRFGEPTLALAAYNAGPGAVAKYGGIPPFKETQNYVRAIMGGAPVGTGVGSNVSMSSSGGAPMRGLLDEETNDQGGLVRLLTGESKPWTSRLNDIGATLLALSGSPAAAPLMDQMSQRRAARQEEARANRTAQWLISQGREDLAQAMMTGAIDPKTAASVALQPPERQGRVVDAAALRQMFPNAEIAEGLYSMQPDGTISKVGGGGPSVNIDMGGGKFEEGFAKGDAELLGTVYSAGLQAQRNLGRIDQLERLLTTAPTGAEGALKMAAGQFGINTEGLSEAQAAQAMINSLVPEQRQPGSGPMSDADLALFKQSLPRIINQPGGNALIIDTMRKIAQYDAEGAAIVQELRSGTIDRPTAFARLAARQNPLANLTVPAAPAAPATGGATDVLTPEDYQYLGIGTP